MTEVKVLYSTEGDPVNIPPAIITKKYSIVNLAKPPYNNWLKVDGGNYPWLEKSTADTLLSIAKTEQGKIHVLSALRGKRKNMGTSHYLGYAVDIQGIEYKGESWSKVRSKDIQDKRRVALRSKYAYGEDKVLISGMDKYNNGHGITNPRYGVVKVKGHADEVVILNEISHLESAANDGHLPNGIARYEVREANNAIIRKAIESKEKQKASDSSILLPKDMAEITFSYDENGRILDTAPEWHASLTGAVPETIKEKVAVLGRQDLNVRKSDIKIVKKPVSPVRVGTTNPKSAAMETDISYNPNKGMTGYVRRSESVLLNKDRSVTAKDLGIQASSPDKLVRNHMPDKAIHGSMFKYKEAEQPAAIRLILDKMFEHERDTVAVAAWEQWEKSGVTYIDNFIINRITSSSKENYRIIASLSDDYKIYFGTSQPEILQITGNTLNLVNQQWLYDFRIFYDRYLRGSKLVQNRIRAFLTFDDAIFEVLLTSFTYSESASIPGSIALSLDLVVLQWTPFGDYKDPLTRDRTATKNNLNYSSNQVNMSPQTQRILNAVNADTDKSYATVDNQSKLAVDNYKRLMGQILAYGTPAVTALPMVFGSGKNKQIVNVKSSEEANKTKPSSIPSSKENPNNMDSVVNSVFDTNALNSFAVSTATAMTVGEVGKETLDKLTGLYTRYFEGHGS